MTAVPPAGESPEIQHLRADARFARDRLALYRAKAYGMRETSPVRMRELERNADATAERLAAALRAAGKE
ncbi:hypothetical protein DSM112329_04857 [Paraconexibacter sp. AEG42_29]|uniref:Uncharacterized protein n=1 Tax=Paraconexibacter sp. AEG42_29 TaxID=2997339 RepID=A0AAU7B200_9ACTN